MTAAVAKGSTSANQVQGLRPIEPRRDMAEVARLIEISFAGELDPSSRRMVREMRAFGRAGWLGWLLGRLFLPPAAYPMGFVWEEEGELVGNASLLPVSRQSDRWVLANVAVHPDHRRHGIGKAMVLACMELAERKGAAELVLQVRHDNQAAKELYWALDFEVLTTRTSWHRRAPLQSEPADQEQIRSASEDEWAILWQLAQRLFPEGVQWPYRLRREWFEPSPLPSLLAPNRNRAWVHPAENGQPTAGLVARLNQDNQSWQLIVLVPEPARGDLEMGLIRRAAHKLRSSGLPLSLSYPPDLIDAELSGLGFQARRTLTWMGLAFDQG